MGLMGTWALLLACGRVVNGRAATVLCHSQLAF